MVSSPTGLTFQASFRDREELRLVYERELLQGGYFLTGAEALPDRQRCLVVFLHPDGRRLELEAEAVFRSPLGVGLQLLGFDEKLKQRLHDFVEGTGSVERAEHEPNPYLRLRGLTVAEQLKKARTGELQERVALERLYGKSVWETLLTNPRISIAEVARVARKATLPIPLVEQIAGHDGWVNNPEVRRALLSNPRLRGRSLQRVLSSLSKAELKLVEQQTAYPAHVRAEASRRVKR